MVKRNLSSFGWRIPFRKIEFKTIGIYGEEIRWTAEIPANYNIEKNILGFTATTDRVLLSVNAQHYFYKPEDLDMFSKMRIESYLLHFLNIDKYVIVKHLLKENFCYYYISDETETWRLLGEWTLNQYYNISTRKEFYMAIEKVAIYPTRIEPYILTRIYRTFTSFVPGPAWLQEEIGLTDIVLSAMTKTLPGPQKYHRKIQYLL